MQSFGDFFNAHNPEHRAAYRHLEDAGYWPEGFIPDDVDMGPTWHVIALAKLAQAWLEYTSAGDPAAIAYNKGKFVPHGKEMGDSFSG